MVRRSSIPSGNEEISKGVEAAPQPLLRSRAAPGKLSLQERAAYVDWLQSLQERSPSNVWAWKIELESAISIIPQLRSLEVSLQQITIPESADLPSELFEKSASALDQLAKVAENIIKHAPINQPSDSVDRQVQLAADQAIMMRLKWALPLILVALFGTATYYGIKFQNLAHQAETAEQDVERRIALAAARAEKNASETQSMASHVQALDGQVTAQAIHAQERLGAFEPRLAAAEHRVGGAEESASRAEREAGSAQAEATEVDKRVNQIKTYIHGVPMRAENVFDDIIKHSKPFQASAWQTLAWLYVIHFPETMVSILALATASFALLKSYRKQ